MPIKEYKETQRTLVTEITLNSVTARTRGTLYRQSAANLINNTDPITDIDVSVNESVPYVILQPIKHIFSLSVPERVKVTFEKDGMVIDYEVKDFFLFNGAFDGQITVEGLNETDTRCDLIFA